MTVKISALDVPEVVRLIALADSIVEELRARGFTHDKGCRWLGWPYEGERRNGVDDPRFVCNCRSVALWSLVGTYLQQRGLAYQHSVQAKDGDR